MKKLEIVIGLLLIIALPLISSSQSGQRMLNGRFVASQENEGGPIIEWWETNETVVIAWDGAYTGQTEDVFGYTAWVNDTDGVSSVIFRYQWMGESGWMNRSAIRITGNSTNGQFRGNLTYAVWWNYTSGYPETEGSGGNFYFKIWANDTLGNWSETSAMEYTGGYMIVSPPLDYIPWSDQLVLTIASGGIILVVILLLVLFKRRM